MNADSPKLLIASLTLKRVGAVGVVEVVAIVNLIDFSGGVKR